MKELFDLFFANLIQRGIDGFNIQSSLWLTKDIPEHLYAAAESKIPNDGEKYQVIGFKVELLRYNKPEIIMYHIMPYKDKYVEKAFKTNNYKAIMPDDVVEDFKQKIATMLMTEGLEVIVQRNLQNSNG